METKQTEIKTTALQKVTESLLQMQQEIDELVRQLSLGKSEVFEKFEVTKKLFAYVVKSIKQDLQSSLDQMYPQRLEMKFRSLELQLQNGKAESKESFDLQTKSIKKSTIALKDEIRSLSNKVGATDYFGY